MSKQKQTQSKLSIGWNKPRIAKKLARDILLILLGICCSVIVQQNQAVQLFLYSFIPKTWRLPMGLIIILLVVVFIIIFIGRLDRVDKKREDYLISTLDTIAKKLGVSQEEIEESNINKDKIRNNKQQTISNTCC